MFLYEISFVYLKYSFVFEKLFIIFFHESIEMAIFLIWIPNINVKKKLQISLRGLIIFETQIYTKYLKKEYLFIKFFSILFYFILYTELKYFLQK